MTRSDWKKTIRINIIMLRISGLWPSGDGTYKLNFYSIYAFLSIFTFVLGHNFFQSFNIIFILDDLQAVTATIFISLTNMLSILKTYYLIQNMKLLKKLMVEVDIKMFQPKNLRQRNLIKPSLKFWKAVYTTFSVMAVNATFQMTIFPIMDKSGNRLLPFLAWYPYDAKISPLYEVTYVYQVASISFISIIILNVDTLIAAMNVYIGAQCDILCDNLRHLHESTNIRNELINCIYHHKAILRLAENSNKIFNWIIFMQFFVSTISLGMTMFQLTVVAPLSSEFYSYLFYGNAVVVEIFMYCWFGNEVEIKSSNIPYAAFEWSWTEVPVEVQKTLNIFIMRCQKPIKISAINLFYLTLETFMKILRTSYSYFAVLNQVNG